MQASRSMIFSLQIFLQRCFKGISNELSDLVFIGGLGYFFQKGPVIRPRPIKAKMLKTNFDIGRKEYVISLFS